MKVAGSFAALSDGRILIDGQPFDYRIGDEITVQHTGGGMVSVTIRLFVDGEVTLQAYGS